MTDRPSGNDPAGPAPSPGPTPEADQPARQMQRRRRITLSVLAAVVLIGAIVAAGFVLIGNLTSSIPRTHVGRLAGPASSETVLITGAGLGPTGLTASASASASSAPQFSGLIMMLHINVSKKAGGVVSIPPLAMVQVPGAGRAPIENALGFGGPTLLVQTVEQLTNLPINHYAQIDFAHVSKMIDAVGGVDVDIPKPSVSFGHKFQAGQNQLNGVTALYYVRDPSITEEGRVLRQQNLVRAILFKLANRHLLTNPVTMVHVLSALTSMLTVDSNFTNSDLMTLAKELSSLNGKAGTFLTAPYYTAGAKVYLDARISGQLWQATKQDSIAAFAKKYPFTVTPQVVP
jgi:LCP family protein required for cell wall assembly